MWLSEAVRPDTPRLTEPQRWIAFDPASEEVTILHLAPGALTDAPGGPTDLPVRSPLDFGTDGGEFFTQGADTDLPGDQSADDGMATCFETTPLSEPLDIIGRPTLRLPISLDDPQRNLIARLCDVHPDGTSHRITLAILNLSHRTSSAEPTPMIPGTPDTVTLRFDATAYRLLPGHRLRVAISTAYFPMILPPPSDVMAILHLSATAQLHLPCPDFEIITLPEGTDTRPRFHRETPASAARIITRDRASGTTTVHVTHSTGQVRHPENGLEWCDDRASEWSITRSDPLSLEGHETCTGWRRRDGIETHVIATGTLRVSATH